MAVFETLATGWNKADEILQYGDKTKYPPESTFLVELADHTFEVKQEPRSTPRGSRRS